MNHVMWHKAKITDIWIPWHGPPDGPSVMWQDNLGREHTNQLIGSADSPRQNQVLMLLAAALANNRQAWLVIYEDLIAEVWIEFTEASTFIRDVEEREPEWPPRMSAEVREMIENRRST